MNDEDDGNDKDKWDGGALLWTWSILVVGEGGALARWMLTAVRQRCITVYYKSARRYALTALLCAFIRHYVLNSN